MGCNAMYVGDVEDIEMFLLITSLIFNGFSIRKSFGKLRYRAFQLYHQILCLLKHVEEVEDRSSTPMGCNAIYVEDIEDRKYLQYTQDLMLWLERSKSQLSKTFFGLKIR